MCVPVRQIFCGYQKLSPEIKLLIALLKFKPRRNIDFYMYLEKQAERQRHWNEKQYSNSVDKDNSTDWNWGQDKERQTQSAVPWSRTSPLPLLNWHTPEYQYHTYQQISPEKIIPVYQFGFVNSLDRRGQHAFCEIKFDKEVSASRASIHWKYFVLFTNFRWKIFCYKAGAHIKVL